MSIRSEDFWRKLRTISLKVAVVLAGVAVIFEIGVRFLPPDAVQYSVQSSTNGGPLITKSGTITDPSTVARWRADVTGTPSGKLLIGVIIEDWRGPVICNSAPLGYYSASYVFLWHGLPIEAVFPLQTCDGEFEISSGGIPDPRTFVVPPLAQP